MEITMARAADSNIRPLGAEPSSPVNLPNSITLARIACVPLFLWALATTRLSAPYGRQEIVAACLFLLGSVTDGLDGQIARRTGRVTVLGGLLSPLADKLLVSTAFVALVYFAPELVAPWIAVIIVAREFLVTTLQSVATQQHMELSYVEIGKYKTVVQAITVVSILMAHAWPIWFGDLSGILVARASIWLLITVSVLTSVASLRFFLAEAVRQLSGDN
jgi:CDP-diacylglycerol--glycerol-3-phosphate 3-phosphatidyltransferase